ncbi:MULTISPECIES: hypothetical protein [unclassified Streptomyces]|uniref:hypothetical protein n=1 Tax=unclassified Streptomyces TaxID=2593676 RepID=UPI000DC3D98A|nr:MULTISPECIES: hypothetical protein [unclassified Streptomyces]RAJ69462.1 hypothetical protein K377_08066 [Streptomyces sp. PsTaAH-137]
MTGRTPDLPAPRAPMTAEAVLARWPTGAWKTELIGSVLYFHGAFDERDVDTAARAYPGRRVLVNTAHDLEVHPAGTTPLLSILDEATNRARPTLTRIYLCLTVEP